VDLIALTTHGSRSVLGSVGDAVVRDAPCPVLLGRPPDGAAWKPRWRDVTALAAEARADGRREVGGGRSRSPTKSTTR
jgi:hypothetical protein